MQNRGMTTQREMAFILIIFDRLYAGILITIDAILQLCYINLFPPQHPMNKKIKDQFLFNLPPSRQSFVYRGDTIHTSLLVFAEHSVTKFSSCFERCRIWHIVYSCMMKRMRVSKPDITSNRVVCLHIAKTMLVYAQNELTLLQSYRSD